MRSSGEEGARSAAAHRATTTKRVEKRSVAVCGAESGQRVGVGACVGIISTLSPIRRAAAGRSETAAVLWECRDGDAVQAERFWRPLFPIPI